MEQKSFTQVNNHSDLESHSGLESFTSGSDKCLECLEYTIMYI